MAHYINKSSGYNAFKGITICSCLHTEISSTYYNDKGDVFRYILGTYIKSYMK